MIAPVCCRPLRETINESRQAAEGASNVLNAVEEISSALREQSSASMQIAQSVERIAQMTEENSAVTEVFHSASHLDQLAEKLKTSVGRFKV